jgi:hypothetical protein
MSAENWHEERDRLVKLLAAVESGKITHIDAENQRELQLANPVNIKALASRLAQLDARLGADHRHLQMPSENPDRGAGEV